MNCDYLWFTVVTKTSKMHCKSQIKDKVENITLHKIVFGVPKITKDR